MERRQFLAGLIALPSLLKPLKPEKQWHWTDDRWQRVHYSNSNTSDIGMPVKVWDGDEHEWRSLVYLNARTGEAKTVQGFKLQLKMPIVVWTIGEPTTPQIRRLLNESTNDDDAAA